MRVLVRAVLAVVALLLVATALSWGAGRMGAADRRISVHRTSVAPTGPSTATDTLPGGRSGASSVALSSSLDTAGRIRILAWNLAHLRGAGDGGLLRNWRGGGAAVRDARLDSVARAIRALGADVVVLNEVDFRASWSGGVNQAEALARRAGYPVRVEQRNYDVTLPFGGFVFGNAVLSRLPVQGADPVDIPPHSGLEAVLVGAKRASVVRVETGHGPLAVVPIHLDPRSARTRMAAVPVLERLRERESAPLVLAGDFNASPPGWPGTPDTAASVVGHLLAGEFRDPRAERRAGRLDSIAPGVLTWPTREPARALDWVLVEPPLRVVEAGVLSDELHELSDHAPVWATVELPDRTGTAGEPEPEGRPGGAS